MKTFNYGVKEKCKSVKLNLFLFTCFLGVWKKGKILQILGPSFCDTLTDTYSQKELCILQFEKWPMVGFNADIFLNNNQPWPFPMAAIAVSFLQLV